MDRSVDFYKGNKYEGWLEEESLQENFFLITDSRRIVFIFRKGEREPRAVRKYGKRAEIENEFINHQKAYHLFPTKIPPIYFFRLEGEMGDLCMEYVNESHLNNIVASVWTGKKKRFLKEMRETFLFLMEILKTLPIHEGKVEDSYSYQIAKWAMDNDIQKVNQMKETRRVEEIMKEVSGIRLPLCMQHRDFCLRNILYSGMQGKMIIDWEDSKEGELPMVDFNMLLVSIIQAYEELFRREKDEFFNENNITEMVEETREEIRQYLGLEKGIFDKISILATFSLWSQNLKKERFKIAEEIFSFLNKELS